MHRKGSVMLVVSLVVIIIVAALLIWQYAVRDSHIAPSTVAAYKTCSNTKLGFSVQYPSDWAITIPHDGIEVSDGNSATNVTLSSCEDPRITHTITLAPSAPTSTPENFNLDVCNSDCMNTTPYKGITTLDQYVAILTNFRSQLSDQGPENPVISTGTLDGVDSARIYEGSSDSYIVAIHNGEIYEIFSSTTSTLASFKFLN